MAHILIVLSAAADSPVSPPLEWRVERALLGIQAPGMSHPVVTHARDGLALGVLGAHGAGMGSAPACHVRGSLDGPEGPLHVALAGLTIQATSRSVRIQSDSVGSRTLWFCRLGEQHLMSTSQRALISWLGELQSADAAAGWFMVTGSTGPGLSWDRRVRALPPASTLYLQASSSAQELTVKEDRFERSADSSRRLRDRMSAALQAVAEELPQGPGIALSLSGGLDSRILLALARGRSSLPCVTWGAPGALDDPRTDAAVAQRVAGGFGAPFWFLPIRPAELDSVVDNYVAASEGRVDHLTGYLDGMALWRTLALEHKVSVLLRGDEAFGWLPVLTSADVRRSVGAPELADFGNASLLIKRGFGELALPSLPADLRRRAAETLPSWRDRLYQQFRLPTILAALTGIKSGYLETVNPLLDERIVSVVRTLADADRTGKRLFREVALTFPVAARFPLATFDGRTGLSPAELARAAGAELDSREAAVLLPPKLHEWLRVVARARAVAVKPTSPGRLHTIRRMSAGLLPTFLRRVVRNSLVREQLGVDTLLLRATILCRTLRLLNGDARRLFP